MYLDLIPPFSSVAISYITMITCISKDKRIINCIGLAGSVISLLQEPDFWLSTDSVSGVWPYQYWIYHVAKFQKSINLNIYAINLVWWPRCYETKSTSSQSYTIRICCQ